MLAQFDANDLQYTGEGLIHEVLTLHPLVASAIFGQL